MEDGLRRRRGIPDAVMVTALIVLLTMDTAMEDGIMDMDISMAANVVATVVHRVSVIETKINWWLRASYRTRSLTVH